MTASPGRMRRLPCKVAFMLADGTLLGPYRICSLLGAGGMGEVYRARDTRLARDVAVKVIPLVLARDPERVRRFEQEARAAAALIHPNVCAILDVGLHDGAPFVVMELLEGETLRDRLRGGALPARKAADLAAQAANGLAAAHEKGIVHRDLKPENLFITRDGRVKLLDFGLAKLTRPAEDSAAPQAVLSAAGTEFAAPLGTVGYMSPEQVLGRPADARSDLFALGATLFEMLTGRRAFAGATPVDTLHAILNSDPGPLSASGREVMPGLEGIVRRCLEKHPAERFQNASDLAFDLQSLSGAPESAGARGQLPPGRQRRRLRFAYAAAVAGAGVALVSLLALWLARREAAEAPGRVHYQRVTFLRGTISAARFAPDGVSVYFSAAWDGGPLALYESKLDAPVARPLGIEHAHLLAVSRDGTLALRLGSRDALWLGGSSVGDLAELRAIGGAPRVSARGVNAADYGPSVDRPVLLRRDSAGARIELAPHRVLRVTLRQAPFLRVSPSGDLVAVCERTSPPNVRGRVLVVDAAGRIVARSAEWRVVLGLAWAPGGREVWYSAAGDNLCFELRALGRDGRERVIQRFPGTVALHDIAADGRVLLSRAQVQAGIRGRAAPEGPERELGWLDFPGLAEVTPDGQRILFTEQATGGGPQYAACVRGMDGSPPLRLGEGAVQGLSPDGRWVLSMLPGPPSALVLLPFAPGEPLALPRGPIAHYQSAHWLPDGRRLVITATGADGAMHAYLQELGTDPARASAPVRMDVALEANDAVGLRPSPDGRWLAGSARGRVVLVPLDGAPARELAVLGPDEYIVGWSGDGRALHLAAPRSSGMELHHLDLATGQRRLEHRFALSDPAGVRVRTVSLSADERAWAFGYLRWLDDLYLVRGLR